MASMCMAMGILVAGADPEEAVRSPQEGWDFRLKDFVIAAWVPPAVSDAEFQLYQECGFNLVMSNRYVLPDEALDGIQMLSGSSTEGRKIRLSLAGGEGQLLRLGL